MIEGRPLDENPQYERKRCLALGTQYLYNRMAWGRNQAILWGEIRHLFQRWTFPREVIPCLTFPQPRSVQEKLGGTPYYRFKFSFCYFPPFCSSGVR